MALDRQSLERFCNVLCSFSCQESSCRRRGSTKTTALHEGSTRHFLLPVWLDPVAMATLPLTLIQRLSFMYWIVRCCTDACRWRRRRRRRRRPRRLANCARSSDLHISRSTALTSPLHLRGKRLSVSWEYYRCPCLSRRLSTILLGLLVYKAWQIKMHFVLGFSLALYSPARFAIGGHFVFVVF